MTDGTEKFEEKLKKKERHWRVLLKVFSASNMMKLLMDFRCGELVL